MLKTQASYQANATIEPEVKSRKKSNVSNQSLGFAKNKQLMDKNKQLEGYREIELMNESAPLNI